MNIALVMYVAGTKPLAGKFLNRIEVFNEVNVEICTLYMIMFTDYISDPQMQ